MAFNSQGRWVQKDWDSFKTFVRVQLLQTEKRLHFFRFRSAILRRKLERLNQTHPPVFDASAKNASVSFAEDKPVYPRIWKPPVVTGAPQQLAQQVFNFPARSSAFTGVPVSEIKDLLYRELDAVQYHEHLIQKLKFEIEQIESEIYKHETANAKIEENLKLVDAQFLDPNNAETLLSSNSILTLLSTDPQDPEVMKKVFRGLIDIKEEIESNKQFYPGFAKDPKAMTNLSMAGVELTASQKMQVG